ncbi:MAG: hypothetical protein M0P95_13840 [Sulfuritalea sp.]|jgi:hypothetical protein|nr:hypothetical protein [Sulfuritalea sp.]
MSRRNPWGEFFQNFNSAYDTGNKVGKQIGMTRAAGIQPETIETQTLGDETTTGNDGMVYDSDTGQYLPKYMDRGQPTEQAQAQQNTPPDEPSRAPEGVTPTFATETRRQYRLGSKTQDQRFTDDQLDTHRLRGMSAVALRFGDPAEAAQYDALAARRRQTSDQEAIRTVLAGGDTRGVVPERSSGLHGKPEASDKPMEAVVPAVGTQKPRSYLETVGPRVMDAYLKQGKVDEAKAWRDFTESEGGHAYANDFAQAQRLVTAGDFETAAPVLERLYNRGYPDGRQAKLTSLGDGNFKLDVFDQKSGQQLGSKTMPAADMGKMAISALAPTKLVEFMANQEGKRATEAASLNKSLELERLRQEGRDTQDDRRDERLATRIGADAERRAGKSPLTPAQQRSNAEIDAAREAVAGMSPQDIMRKTAKATNTGRENPDYDPSLARQAGLANRRKIGDDELFDTRQNRQQSGDTFAGKPVTEMTEAQLQQFGRSAGAEGKAKIDTELTRRAFMGDQTMQGHRLGEMTPKGYKVFDPQGRHVGYYRR